jgi:hypothetical protein
MNAGRALAPAIAIGALACTFTGLGDYRIGDCDPTTKMYTEDTCSTMHAGDVPGTFDLTHTSCRAVAQCVPSGAASDVGKCVALPFDYDRDGDPVCAEGGGGDCADDDPTRSHSLTEVCDQIDNDCSGVKDDNLQWTLSSSAAFGLGARASPDGGFTYVATRSDGGDCVVVLQGEPTNKPDCTVLATGTITPRQPVGRYAASSGATSSDAAVVYVDVVTGDPTCSSRIEMANTQGVIAQAPCMASTASHPGFAVSDDGSYGLVVYSDAPPAPESSGPECATAPQAPIRFRLVHDPFAPTAVFDVGAELTESGRAAGPLTVLTLPRSPLAAPGTYDPPRFLVAVPDAGGVSVWVIDAYPAQFVRTARFDGPSFSDVRAVDGSEGTIVSAESFNGAGGIPTLFGFVAQSGCAPATLSFFEISSSASARTLALDVLPAKAGDVSWMSLSWSSRYEEWRLIASGSSGSSLYRIADTLQQPYAAIYSSFPARPALLAAAGPTPLTPPSPIATFVGDNVWSYDPTKGTIGVAAIGCAQ